MCGCFTAKKRGAAGGGAGRSWAWGDGGAASEAPGSAAAASKVSLRSLMPSAAQSPEYEASLCSRAYAVDRTQGSFRPSTKVPLWIRAIFARGPSGGCELAACWWATLRLALCTGEWIIAEYASIRQRWPGLRNGHISSKPISQDLAAISGEPLPMLRLTHRSGF